MEADIGLQLAEVLLIARPMKHYEATMKTKTDLVDTVWSKCVFRCQYKYSIFEMWGRHSATW